MDYRQRKAERVEHYKRFVSGWRLRECIACSGSGRYDNNGSPPCCACDGTGKTRYNTATGTTQALPFNATLSRKTCGITLRDEQQKQPPALTNKALIAIINIATKDAT